MVSIHLKKRFRDDFNSSRVLVTTVKDVFVSIKTIILYPHTTNAWSPFWMFSPLLWHRRNVILNCDLRDWFGIVKCSSLVFICDQTATTWPWFMYIICWLSTRKFSVSTYDNCIACFWTSAMTIWPPPHIVAD